MQIKSPPTAKSLAPFPAKPKNWTIVQIFCQHLEMCGVVGSGLPMGEAVLETACHVEAHFFCAPTFFCRLGCLGLLGSLFTWRGLGGAGGCLSYAT
jgi:hypothetical protein